jgi:ribosomal protein S18 acetylase RimI-like enzyme
MISYFVTDEKELDSIKELWEKLNLHHQSRTKYFFQDYENIVFEDRKEELIKKSGKGALRIDLAIDSNSELVIGYCISSISNGKGEIDSIYVEEKFRSKGIGDNLMKNSLRWMDEEGVETREVQLLAGNDDAIQFYSHYGFHPKHILLKQKNDQL